MKNLTVTLSLDNKQSGGKSLEFCPQKVYEPCAKNSDDFRFQTKGVSENGTVQKFLTVRNIKGPKYLQYSIKP